MQSETLVVAAHQILETMVGLGRQTEASHRLNPLYLGSDNRIHGANLGVQPEAVNPAEMS